jgi:hypothetical protein
MPGVRAGVDAGSATHVVTDATDGHTGVDAGDAGVSAGVVQDGGLNGVGIEKAKRPRTDSDVQPVRAEPARQGGGLLHMHCFIFVCTLHMRQGTRAHYPLCPA